MKHDKPVYSLAISPDREFGVSTDATGTIKAWSIPDGTPKWPDKNVGQRNIDLGPGPKVALSPDRHIQLLVAIAGAPGEVYFFDSATGELRDKRNLGGLVYTTVFSHDAAKLAIGCDLGTCLWELATGKLVKTATITWERCDWLAFSPDDRVLAARGRDTGVLVFWDIGSGQKAGRLLRAEPLSLSPDGGSLASGTGGKTIGLGGEDTVNVWAVAPSNVDAYPNTTRLLRADSCDNFPLATSPDGKTVAVSQNKRVVLWDTARGGKHELGNYPARILGFAFSPNGDYLASADEVGHIGLWDVHGRELIHTFDTGLRGWPFFGFPYNGTSFVFCNGEGAICFWDLDSRQILRTIPFQRGEEWLAFSPDARHWAAASFDAVVVWRLGSSVPLIRLQGPYEISALSFSPDSCMLAVATWGDLVTLYEVGTWRRLWERHTDGLFCTGLVFSPDNKTLLTASPSGEVRFWQVATGQEVGTLRMNEKVRKLAFLDADTLVTGSMEGFVRVWRTSNIDQQRSRHTPTQ